MRKTQIEGIGDAIAGCWISSDGCGVETGVLAHVTFLETVYVKLRLLHTAPRELAFLLTL